MNKFKLGDTVKIISKVNWHVDSEKIYKIVNTVNRTCNGKLHLLYLCKLANDLENNRIEIPVEEQFLTLA